MTDTIGIVSALLSLGSIIAGNAGDKKLVLGLDRLRSTMVRHLRVQPSHVEEIIRTFPEGDDVESIASFIRNCLGRFGAPSVASATQAEVLRLIRGQSVAVGRLSETIRSSVQGGASADTVDIASALVAAQRADRSCSHCLGIIPLSALFVEPELQSVDHVSNDGDARGPCVLQAPYGAGKSTLMRMIATGFASPAQINFALGDRPALAVYVNAASMMRYYRGSLRDAVAGVVRDSYGVDVENLLVRGDGTVSLRILLDGWDEVADLAQAALVFGHCLELEAKASGLQLVFGARDSFFGAAVVSDLCEQFAVRRFRVMPLGRQQQDDWLCKWNAIAAELRLSRLSSRDLIKSKGKRSQVYQTPLILLLHGLLKGREDLRGATPSDFFDKVVSMTIDGKALVPAGQFASGLVDRGAPVRAVWGSREQRAKLLQEVAVLARRGNGRSVALHDVKVHIEAAGILGAIEPDSAQIELWLRDLQRVHFFEGGATEIGFVHSGFIDFLCAMRCIGQGCKSQDVAELSVESRWMCVELSKTRSWQVDGVAAYFLDSIESWVDKKESHVLLGFCLFKCSATQLPGAIVTIVSYVQRSGVMEWLGIDETREVASLSEEELDDWVIGNDIYSRVAEHAIGPGRRLSGATWKEEDMLGLQLDNLDGVDMDGMNIDGVTGVLAAQKSVWKKCVCKNWVVHIKLVQIALEDVLISGCDWAMGSEGAQFVRCAFVGGSVVVEVGSNAEMVECTFQGVEMRGDWSGVKLTRCRSDREFPSAATTVSCSVARGG
jgi:hypothetical protein